MNDRDTLIKGLVGAVGGFGSVAVSSVLHAWLSVLVLLAGFCVSVVTIWSIWKGRQKAEIEMWHEVARLCADCVRGTPPPRCPLPQKIRPANCPLLKVLLEAKRSAAVTGGVGVAENNGKGKG
jgi:hypothetical protein